MSFLDASFCFLWEILRFQFLLDRFWRSIIWFIFWLKLALFHRIELTLLHRIDLTLFHRVELFLRFFLLLCRLIICWDIIPTSLIVLSRKRESPDWRFYLVLLIFLWWYPTILELIEFEAPHLYSVFLRLLVLRFEQVEAWEQRCFTWWLPLLRIHGWGLGRSICPHHTWHYWCLTDQRVFCLNHSFSV